MSNLLLETYIKTILEARREPSLRQFYGSNFLHTLNQYTSETDGLADYGVTYSELPKWGIAPNSKHFPIGVYFYFLSPTCKAGSGKGFATDRAYANIAKINYDRMIVLKQGHPQHFTSDKAREALDTVETKFPQIGKITENPYDFTQFTKIIYKLGKKLNLGFNKMLHESGYDGIVDFDGSHLPIESCQGVQTYPGGVEYIMSIHNPSNGKKHRYQNLFRNLTHQKPGSLKLKPEEIQEIMDSYSEKDANTIKDIFSSLLRAVDLSEPDVWNGWAAKMLTKYGVGGYEVDLEVNPTTPSHVWEKLLNHADEGVHLTAKDMLKKLNRA